MKLFPLPLVKRSLYNEARAAMRDAAARIRETRLFLEAIASNEQVMRVLDTGYPERGARLPSPHSGVTLGHVLRVYVESPHPRWPPPVEGRKEIIERANVVLAEMDGAGVERPPRWSDTDFDYAVRVLDAVGNDLV